MKYFLGVQNNSKFDYTTFENHNYILFSYYYFNLPHIVKKVLSDIPDHEIIIDSGAFSAWNSNKSVAIEDVEQFYKYVYSIRPDAHFINLDKIPGARGRKPSEQEASEACEYSWKNYLRLRKITDKILPVFHEDDEWKYLQMMKDETDYIAISPANDSHTKKRIVWLDRVYGDLKADYKTHGLAATSEKLLKRYPFYSVDSVNYRAPAMYGRGSSASQAMFKVQRAKAESFTHYMERVIPKEIAHFKKIETDMTKLWKRRGVEWNE
ncbi:hypothetical protein [Polynucleobacter sp.]|uniref:hypothetical protein n=1 Tax=Polynucleobacter sp. TaxID=2029855 RepID=UPI003F69C978